MRILYVSVCALCIHSFAAMAADAQGTVANICEQLQETCGKHLKNGELAADVIADMGPAAIPELCALLDPAQTYCSVDRSLRGTIIDALGRTA
jgi:hypothetical protein